MDIFSASDLFLAARCSQMSARLRWLEGAGTIWAVSGRKKSFYRHLTLGLTHHFIVPANVLMRQNVFSGANLGRRLWFSFCYWILRSWHSTLFNGTIHLTHLKFAVPHFFALATLLRRLPRMNSQLGVWMLREARGSQCIGEEGAQCRLFSPFFHHSSDGNDELRFVTVRFISCACVAPLTGCDTVKADFVSRRANCTVNNAVVCFLCSSVRVTWNVTGRDDKADVPLQMGSSEGSGKTQSSVATECLWFRGGEQCITTTEKI